ELLSRAFAEIRERSWHNDSQCPVRRHQPSPVQEATSQEQRAISSGYLCCANACLDGCIRRNPVAPASGPLANILLFECDSLWISCYGGPNTISNTIDYAMHRSRSHDAVVRVYDD